MTQSDWNGLIIGIIVYVFVTNIIQNVTIKNLQRRVAVLEQRQ